MLLAVSCSPCNSSGVNPAPQNAKTNGPPRIHRLPATVSIIIIINLAETGGSSQASTISPKDDLSLLNINIDNMVRDSLPDMDSNDVDEIFKGVLTDDSQVKI